MLSVKQKKKKKKKKNDHFSVFGLTSHQQLWSYPGGTSVKSQSKGIEKQGSSSSVWFELASYTELPTSRTTFLNT